MCPAYVLDVDDLNQFTYMKVGITTVSHSTNETQRAEVISLGLGSNRTKWSVSIPHFSVPGLSYSNLRCAPILTKLLVHSGHSLNTSNGAVVYE